MLERVLILSVVFGLGLLACRLYTSQQLKRVTQEIQIDPLLLQLRRGAAGVILFTADYCAPCKIQQKPALERLANQLGDRIQIIEVNVEQQPEVAQRWGVMSLPTTFIVDESGTARHVNHGVTPTEKLRTQLEAII